MLDFTQYRFVKRIVVGSTDPTQTNTEEQIEAATELLNTCLSKRGQMLGIETNFMVVQVGGHPVVMQYLAYHVGFTRKPHWLED